MYVHDSGKGLLMFELNSQSYYTPPFYAPVAVCWLAGTVSHIQSQDCVQTLEDLEEQFSEFGKKCSGL